ncbi:MAG: hypothetical protein LBH12_02275 [Dysgonamonadaceae bacterium]|nr:hypothetical protein [Dysgonamonadaceae bacterium]
MVMLALMPIANSCNNEDPVEAEKERQKQECAAKPGENFWNDELNICQHDTKYMFSKYDFSNIMPTDKIKASADSAQVRNIYLVTEEEWTNLADRNINNMINNVFKPAKKVSLKVKGKGNLKFKLGVINPADSLWLVQFGFTVNQH